MPMSRFDFERSEIIKKRAAEAAANKSTEDTKAEEAESANAGISEQDKKRAA